MVRDLQDWLARNIPLTAALEVEVRDLGPAGLVVAAPLAPNRNDKNTAFAGSLAAVATLTGWGMTWVSLREQGREVDIVIARSRLQYRRPVGGEIVAVCPRPARERLDALMAELDEQGRARWELDVVVDTPAGRAVDFAGTYVVRSPEVYARSLER